MKIKQAMPHSLVLLMDYCVGEIPSSFTEGLVTSTPTCIAIGTVSEDDGVTSVLVTHAPQNYSDGLLKIYTGSLLTPSKELSLVDTGNHVLATMKVFGEEINLDIWVDHPLEPENIVIGINEKIATRIAP